MASLPPMPSVASLTAISAQSVVGFGVALSLMLTGTEWYSYNFPLMLFGVIALELSGNRPLMLFTMLTLVTALWDGLSIIFFGARPGLFLGIVNAVLIVTKILAYNGCKERLRERGEAFGGPRDFAPTDSFRGPFGGQGQTLGTAQAEEAAPGAWPGHGQAGAGFRLGGDAPAPRTTRDGYTSIA